MKRVWWQSALIGCVLSGCSVGPVYKSPEIVMPSQWHNTLQSECDIASYDDVIWWESFHDPILNELMHDAASQNLDLKIAAIRVLQARTEANGKKGDLYPRVDASLNYGHVYYSKNALVNGLLDTAGCDSAKHVKRNVNFFEIGFDAEWEIDLFGLKAHEIAALKAHEESVYETLCGIWVTLSAEIAKNYIELRGYQRRLEMIKRMCRIQEEGKLSTEELLERGVVDTGDYHKAEIECEELRSKLAPLEIAIARAIHRLSILLGYFPEQLSECLLANQLPLELPANFAIGVPSELLRRRPDIRKAERDLAAATERVGSAVAALFPRFSLRGFIGDISTKIGSLFNPASLVYLAGPQLLVPIFNSHLLLEDVEYNKMETQIALYSYQKTVLEALEEAENAIASLKYENERYTHASHIFENQQSRLSLAQELFARGVNDNFALVKIKQEHAAAEEALAQSHVDLLLAYVALYKALGGSWKEQEEACIANTDSTLGFF